MKSLKGTITALITPFIDQKLDEKGLIDMIHFQVDQGIDGILVVGSTGEAPTLSAEEQKRIITLAAQEIKGRVPLWVGTGSYCTRQTIEKTKLAKDLGADVALVVGPYYNKPTQDGIFRHFETITQQVDLPVVVYNAPGRSGVNIETATFERLAKLPNLIGVKECSGNMIQVMEIVHAVVNKNPHFSVYSGDDILAVPMIGLGAAGVLSVVSNLLPKEVQASIRAAREGNLELAYEFHYKLFPLYKASFIETNPIPIKAAMHLSRRIASAECRLPLCPLSPSNLNTLRLALSELNI